MIGLLKKIKQTPAADPDTPSKVKEQSTPKPTPAQTIPAPSPANLGPKYERLWHRAWTLADYIDNPQGASLADRRAKLLEMNRLRARMAEIERQAATAGPEPETSPPGTWTPWEATDTSTRDRTPESCPARCKRSGKCYSKAYFEGKPGKAAECLPADCKYISNERGSYER